MESESSVAEALSAAALRREISARNHARAIEISWGPSASALFEEMDGLHGNFLPASWACISSNPAWRKRLMKSYTSSRFVLRAHDRRRFELDSATSSDALLMNIFCYPRMLSRKPLCTLLGIEPLSPEFGFRPAVPLANHRTDQTEIDMRLGHLLIEAKLTEADFQRAPERLLSRYCDLSEVFDKEQLKSVCSGCSMALSSVDAD